MSRVVKPLKEMGAQIWGRKANSLAPLAVSGESLQPIHYYSPVASAQVKSCLLLAGLLTEGKTTITEPALSRDHSERMLRAFGANIEVDGETNSDFNWTNGDCTGGYQFGGFLVGSGSNRA